MPFDLDRFDRLIADNERRITAQVLRLVVMEREGRDTSVARRCLELFQGILVEYRHARRTIAESCRLAGRF